MTRGISAAVHAALETAFETAIPAEAEGVPYPSAVDEAPCECDVFLPRRRPTEPPPAAPRDDAPHARPVDAPGPPRHQAPDLAVLDQVLRGLQRLA